MYSPTEVHISSQPHHGDVGLASTLVSSTSSPMGDPSSALYAMLSPGLNPSLGVDRPRRKFGKKSHQNQNYETRRGEERSLGRREERYGSSIERRDERSLGRREERYGSSVERREERSLGRREEEHYGSSMERREERSLGRREEERSLGRREEERSLGRREEELYGNATERNRETQYGREERYEEMTDDLSPRSCNSTIRTSSRGTPSDYGSTRKDNKPQMEKKRRQREKQSLNKLREYILTAFKVDPSKYMDKAEILEKTVKFMQYIMSKHYSGEDVEWKKQSKNLQTLSSLSPEPNFEKEKVELSDGCNQFNISNSNNQNVKLHLINNNNRLFSLNNPTNNDQVVTLILPQFGPNFSASPYQMQPDNDSNSPINQLGSQQQIVNDNFPDYSAAKPASPMKFVVNHNYYMNSPQNAKQSPTEKFYREVLTPDTTTADNFSHCEDQGQLLQNPSVFPSLPESSARYLPKFSSNPRRIAPKLSIFSDQNNNKQRTNHMAIIVKQTPASNLHRPWEK